MLSASLVYVDGVGGGNANLDDTGREGGAAGGVAVSGDGGGEWGQR
jgi:hypothetical protein